MTARFDEVIHAPVRFSIVAALAGVEFDPALHEAVMRQPHAEVPADHVVQVFRNGYVRDGRVLRAAQVMVSAGDE